jgi:hypothetical protein
MAWQDASPGEAGLWSPADLKTGAGVGDLFMSPIHTAELYRVEPFDYLAALLRHAAALALDPGAWMPSSPTATLAAEPAPG